MRVAGADFYKVMHMWKHPMVRRRDKLRMFRRYLMKLVYAGANTLILDDKACAALNDWTSSKVKYITGRTGREENSRKTVDVVGMLRHWRRRWIGQVLRSNHNDIRRQELLPHVELVVRGYLPREGGPLMNAPAFTSVKDLIEQAGYVPAVPIEMLGLKTRAKAEKARKKWLEDDEELRPNYGTDSEDEEAVTPG